LLLLTVKKVTNRIMKQVCHLKIIIATLSARIDL